MNAKTSVLFVYNMSLDFGGEYGDYILAFILALNKPIATIFHTVLLILIKKKKNTMPLISQTAL
jgi:hypothetical protein